ncbi:A/G-specific adenine glycosylase [Rhodoferax sp.]|uniref:A/G-specific adenine glycosylase n=1 Tax=Rhodoferax sp. TaxID=50421 RepID=UPI0025FA852C|nr:A/G-specific adenine glycosylase [Rhodoferax sp.]
MSECRVRDFATQVVRWQEAHGRHDLPWQNSRDPYRVWLSEIMLQQTQVATVLDYFPRFLARFPDVESLAGAALDEVLGLWSGLGYYSRARNLHVCAQTVMELHGGLFPQTALVLQTLPGIGRSTAAAIASLCFSERVAILDGNVKRVLTRALGFGGDLASVANERRLWDEATRLLPLNDLMQTMPRYTQGLMDLGATLCTAKNPSCAVCPLARSCVAKRLGQPHNYPVKTRKLKRSSQSIWLLWARAEADSVWLSQRPTPGVWAGLYCLPWFDQREALEEAVPERYRAALQDSPPFTHVLTHKDLHLHPVQVQMPCTAVASTQGRWINAQEWPRMGLPAPVRKLLLQG